MRRTEFVLCGTGLLTLLVLLPSCDLADDLEIVVADVQFSESISGLDTTAHITAFVHEGQARWRVQSERGTHGIGKDPATATADLEWEVTEVLYNGDPMPREEGTRYSLTLDHPLDLEIEHTVLVRFVEEGNAKEYTFTCHPPDTSLFGLPESPELSVTDTLDLTWPEATHGYEYTHVNIITVVDTVHEVFIQADNPAFPYLTLHLSTVEADCLIVTAHHHQGHELRASERQSLEFDRYIEREYRLVDGD